MTRVLGSQYHRFHPVGLSYCDALFANTGSAKTTQNLYTSDILKILVSIFWFTNCAKAVYHKHLKAEICAVLVDLECVFRSDGKLRILINWGWEWNIYVYKFTVCFPQIFSSGHLKFIVLYISVKKQVCSNSQNQKGLWL